jgi:hypothetical protein
LHQKGALEVVTKSKAQNVLALAQANIPVRGFTRKQFATRWGMSEGHYLKLRKKGRGPKEIDLEGVTIIPLESEAEWAAEQLAEAQRLADAQKKISA